MFGQSPFRFRILWASGLSFGTAKAMTFFAALMLPRLVDQSTYGVLELAMTIGIFGSTILGLNIHTAVFRLHLVDKEPHAQTILAGQCFYLAVLGLVTAGFGVLAGGEAVYVLCTAILGLFAIQLYASTYAYMRGLVLLIGWVDGLPMLTIVVSAIILSLMGNAAPLQFAWTVVAIALVATAVSATTLLSASGHELRDLAMRAVKFGGSVTLYSLTTLAISSSSRLAIAQVLSIADVASFSLSLRLALILFFFHQFLGAIFFAQLYQLEGAVVGRIMTVWIVLLSAVATLFAVSVRVLSPWLVVGTQVPAEAIASILPAVTVQVVLWILNGNLEMFINREFLSRRAASVLGGLLSVAVGVGCLMHATDHLSLRAVIHVYIGLMLASLVMQMWLLSGKGFQFGRCYIVLPIVATPLLASLLPVPE